MNVNDLSELPPWQWPRKAGQILRSCIRNPRNLDSEREMAALLAGELVVMNDDMANLLLSVVQGASQPEIVRGAAAIALGPVLEVSGNDGFDDDLEDLPITEPVYRSVCDGLRGIFQDESTPKLVRRRAFEASVRALQDWHAKAIWDLLATKDEDWRITAIFGMRHVPGDFKKPILEALSTGEPELQREAVLAAGPRAVDEAWPYVAKMVESPDTEKSILLAAISTVAELRPDEAGEVLADLADSEDEEIAEAVEEALMMARGGDDFEDEDDDFEDDDFEDEVDDVHPPSKGNEVH